MNETSLTVCGNVATSPKLVYTNEGLPIASFRIASTIRRYDRDARRWVDGETTFLTVTCFRGLAENVSRSIDKGQRVVVTGRLRVKNWARDGKSGTNVEIDAWALGHDLAFGTSSFNRIVRIERVEPGRAEADELAIAGIQEQQGDGEPWADLPAFAGPQDDDEDDDLDDDLDGDGELVDALVASAG